MLFLDVKRSPGAARGFRLTITFFVLFSDELKIMGVRPSRKVIAVTSTIKFQQQELLFFYPLVPECLRVLLNA